MSIKPDSDKTGILSSLSRNSSAAACFLCLLFCGSIFTGCLITKKQGPVFYPAMPDETITTEIAAVETALAQLPAKGYYRDARAALLLKLSMLYAHPDKQTPDYPRAMAYLKQYLTLHDTVHAGYALSLLAGLSECVSSTADKTAAYEDLKKEQEQLEKKYQELSRENSKHKKMLDQLKRLDIQLEKKRKSVD